MIRILMVLPWEDFRDEEYFDPLNYFKNQGFFVQTASTTRLPIPGQLGSSVEADLLLSQIEGDQWDCLVFVGGNGTKRLWTHERTLYLAKKAWEKGKILAGICYGSLIPLKAGVLKYHNMTTYPDARDEVSSPQATYVEAPVVVDGRLITARGPEAALEFAATIARILKGKSI